MPSRRMIKQWCGVFLSNLVILSFIADRACGQDTDKAVLEAIWKLDDSAALPSKYSVAIVGERSILSATRGPGTVEKSFVIFRDASADLKIDAGNSDLFGADMNPLPGGWKIVFASGNQRTYFLGRSDISTFDLSKKLEKTAQDQITVLDRICYRFDPLVFPVAPPSFSDTTGSSTEMIFELFDNGKCEVQQLLEGKIATNWKVGPNLKTRVYIEFEQKGAGSLLPTVAKWSAPTPNSVERQTPDYETVYVVKTEWQMLELDQGRSVPVPKRLTSSYLVGRPPHGDTIDTQLNLHWITSIPDKLEQSWQEFDWYSQLDQIVKQAAEKQHK